MVRNLLVRAKGWVEGEPEFLGLTLVNGEMKDVRTTIPASAKSLATSLIRRIFSSRSSGVKARFLFKPAKNKRNATNKIIIISVEYQIIGKSEQLY